MGEVSSAGASISDFLDQESSHHRRSSISLYATILFIFKMVETGKSLDKESGKRCVMLSAKQLEISFDSPYFWQWISIPESKFDQVPELIAEVSFKIRGVMNTQILSPQTRYSAYIVYKTRERFHGLKLIGVGYIGHGTFETKRWERKDLIKLEEREDGWMETELGEFFTEGGGLLECDEVVLSVIEIDYAYWKRGLIIQGIDIHPPWKERLDRSSYLLLYQSCILSK